jgi:sialate O-acetylesterase
MPLPTLTLPTRFRFPLAFCAIGFAGFATCDHLQADVTLPAIFGDHMVLQRDISAPVWGWATPGETVTVVAGPERATTTAGKDGKWSVQLPKLLASAKPIEINVTGKNHIILHDVLVGDIWVCSGQSNMELGAKAVMPREDFDKTGNPQIRLFSVPKYIAPSPAKDITTAPQGFPLIGTWQVCTPDTLSKTGEWSGFPAVGYYFGNEIHHFTQQPVGLIGTCWGGTRINCWTSIQTLQANPSMASFALGAAKFRDNYEQLEQTYLNVEMPRWKAEVEKWRQDNKAVIDKYNADLQQWEEQKQEARAQKKPGPPKPHAPIPPKEPRDPIHNNQTSAALFNGMIAPLIPYGIKGVVWYQGESNADNPPFYKIALPALITDWRTRWGQGNFPFLVVQLPNFGETKPEPGESYWAGTREAQAHALTLPGTGMAVTIDVAAGGNLHPPDKWDVGYRLALAAQRVAYGQQNVIASGPIYKSFKVEGNKVRIAFGNIGGGLAIGNPPEHFYTTQRQTAPTTPPSELKGFAIAGADHKFAWAKASIDGSSIVVWSENISSPAAVRYAWADNPVCNLYNKEGLPAAPFRTDDFPLGK